MTTIFVMNNFVNILSLHNWVMSLWKTSKLMMYEGLSRVDSTPSQWQWWGQRSLLLYQIFSHILEFFKAPSSIKRLQLILFTVYPTYSTTTGTGLDNGNSERNWFKDGLLFVHNNPYNRVFFFFLKFICFYIYTRTICSCNLFFLK